ncbi:hypothetical protein LQ368_12980 [Halobacterium noricense]|uniref:hypothetical protein n=1 Tax=Halobacterium noricense TaxID=223182 RepID=UPI00073E2EF0|nr:hypothetical protein [Halobacterium noricense]MCG1004347.1 hypothetical protein [Halobacterium noricense]
MTQWNSSHVEILAKMVRPPVYGDHHKQRDTIKDWADLEGDIFEDAMDDLIADPEAPVMEKARGTVTLTSVHDTKEFIREHDEDGEYTWYL